MKRTTAWIMSGIIVSGLVMGYNVVQSDASRNVEAIPYEELVQTTDIKSGHIAPIGAIKDSDMLFPSIEEEIRSYDFLTAKEKEQLIQAEKEAEPHYKKLQELGEKIDRISQKIENKYTKILEEYERLMAQNDDLWLKIVKNETQEAINETDNRELIKRASELTDKEKEQLLQTEDRLDELNAMIDKMYDEIDRATAELNKQVEKQYDKIDRIMQKVSAIQEKIQKQMQKPNLGEDVILY